MATKGDKSNVFKNCASKNDAQYYNLNLNETQTCLTLDTLSKSNSFNKNEGKITEDQKLSKDDSSGHLTLHISAYENSVDALNNSNEEDLTTTNKMNKYGKSWEDVKKICIDPSYFQDPFEFPRQQKDDQANDPEVMQFKASQKLRNPNLSENSK
uniref:Uncharacterized protein n=1 Tax=Panagrolaimus sp. ES5 TaxID=591445 RepID=A0AC34G743_9BILA